jgi:Uma2 family endonuclease
MSAALQLPPCDLTIPEFLEWADATDGLWQLRDGEPELMAPPSEAHGFIQIEFGRVLGNHLEGLGSRCRVAGNPGVIPKLRSNRNMLIPDLAVTCAPPTSGHEMAEPILLIEILSPSNARQTRANVWAFSTIPSVRELVLVRSTSIAAEVLLRREDGGWPDQAELLGPESTLRLASIGFEAPLRALYRTTALA